MILPRLVIFARFPTPGRAKTRLIPALGDAEAARLQDALTRHTLAESAALTDRRQMQVQVRFTGASGDAMRSRYGDRFDYVDQGEGDLGQRLQRAAADQPDTPLVVIGSDCPGISVDLLIAAFDALHDRDVVLGPAVDGGYYLIGWRRFHPALLTDIPWSTPDVFARTRTAADAAGLSVATLPTLADVDVPADLAACGDLLAARADPYRPARLAITGATGSLGQQFLARLLADDADVRVTALVRLASQKNWPTPFRQLLDEHGRRITLIDGDLQSLRLSPEERRQIGEADGGLWHFAASTLLHAATPDAEARIAAVNDGGTARLLDLLAGCDRPGPLFHVSTAYVCGRRSGTVYEHELDHDAGFRNAYERSKHAAERRVRSALSAGLRGMISRPGLIASGAATPGPADIVSALTVGLQAAARNGRRLTLRMPTAAAVNAATADWLPRVLLSLASQSAGRRTYHLTARRPTSIGQLAAAASRAAGIDVRLAPNAVATDLSTAERIVDRMLRPFRPYFGAGVEFDRRNLELDAPHLADAAELDIDALVRQRLA